jgi:hypothetical protein
VLPPLGTRKGAAMLARSLVVRRMGIFCMAALLRTEREQHHPVPTVKPAC